MAKKRIRRKVGVGIGPHTHRGMKVSKRVTNLFGTPMPVYSVETHGQTKAKKGKRIKYNRKKIRATGKGSRAWNR